MDLTAKGMVVPFGRRHVVRNSRSYVHTFRSFVFLCQDRGWRGGLPAGVLHSMGRAIYDVASAAQLSFSNPYKEHPCNRLSEGERAVTCTSCRSNEQKKFKAEIAIHFPGLKNLDKPAVLIFPELLICFECGNAKFSVPESELCLLGKDQAAAAGC